MVWSPPRVMTRGRVLPCLEMPISSALVAGLRIRMLLWPSSICWIAQALSYLGRNILILTPSPTFKVNPLTKSRECLHNQAQ